MATGVVGAVVSALAPRYPSALQIGNGRCHGHSEAFPEARDYLSSDIRSVSPHPAVPRRCGAARVPGLEAASASSRSSELEAGGEVRAQSH